MNHNIRDYRLDSKGVFFALPKSEVVSEGTSKPFCISGSYIIGHAY